MRERRRPITHRQKQRPSGSVHCDSTVTPASASLAGCGSYFGGPFCLDAPYVVEPVRLGLMRCGHDRSGSCCGRLNRSVRMAKPQRNRHVHAVSASALHDSRMPCGGYVPRAFVKLLYEGVVFGPSRKKTIAWIFRLLRLTTVTCGRCGAPIPETIWTRADVARLFDLADTKGLPHLKNAMHREFDARVLTCAACNHVAHLRRNDPTGDDPRAPF